MKKYLTPQLDVLIVKNSDVITESSDQYTAGDDNCKDYDKRG